MNEPKDDDKDWESMVDYGEEDESDRETLEPASGQRRLALPFMILILIFGLVVAAIPFLIFYTIGWMAWDASKY